MPKCEWRDKPSDEPMCKTLADVGQTLCPRHKFLDELRKQQREAKELNSMGAKEAGVSGHLPRTRQELLQRGYHFTGTSACKGCAFQVEWYKTPAGKSAPFDPMPHDLAPAVSHFATCKHRASFRRAS